MQKVIFETVKAQVHDKVYNTVYVYMPGDIIFMCVIFYLTASTLN